MKRRRHEGLCEVTTKLGQMFVLPRAQYATVRAAWLKGARFVDVVDFHGAAGTVKLEDIDGIFDVSAEVLQSRIQESREDEADDSLAGGGV